MSQSDARDLEVIGTVIHGRFLVKSRLAAGGMGVVYQGEQVPLGRPVAIKILETRSDAATANSFSERFLLEAAAVARLSHPNTITLYDYGKTERGDFYYAMEFVDGITLSRAVYEKGPLDAATAIHVGMQICGSLREAHRAGMIHRDLKPGNIMLTEALDDPFFVKVLDFGLVKVMGQDDGVELTQSGMLMGSPRYMAPEQVLGHPLDPRADVYSFGGVLYLALTGYPPFRHGSQFEVLRAQVEEQPAPFAVTQPEHKSSERLERLVFHCLKKDPNERPQSMDAVAQELRACARELGLEEASLSGAIRALPSEDISLPPQSISSPSVSAALPAPSVEPSLGGAPPVEPSIAAAPPKKGGGVLFVVLGAGLLLAVAVGGAAAAFLVPWGDPPPPPAPDVQGVEAPPVEEAPPPATPPATESHRIEIVSEPPGARVRRRDVDLGDVDLGDAPFTVTIPDGEQWELTFTLAGHAPRTVLATSERESMRVHLDPAVEDEEADRRPSGRGARNPRPSAPVPQPATLQPPTPRPLASPTIAPAPMPSPLPRPAPSGRQQDLRNPWGR